MHFGMLVGKVQGTCITWGVDAPMGRGTFGQLKSIVKHRVLGHWVKQVSCTKNGWANLNNLYVVLSFCTRSCLLGVAMIAPMHPHLNL